MTQIREYDMARKRTYNRRNQSQNKILSVLILVAVIGFYLWQNNQASHSNQGATSTKPFSSAVAADDQALLNLKWDGTLDGDVVHINNDKATFTNVEMGETFPSQGSKLRPVDGLSLSPLDNLGRSQQGIFFLVVQRWTKLPNVQIVLVTMYALLAGSLMTALMAQSGLVATIITQMLN